MELLICPKCEGEYFIHTGCSCCDPPKGPYYCPECGTPLRSTRPSYVTSPDTWEYD